MDWKKFRNYEVSVWTIQDNYIATLKSGDPISISGENLPAIVWSQARATGQIQNAKMELNIDGTSNFTFEVPMYLFINGKKVENPNWYSTHNIYYGSNYQDELGETQEINRNILTSMRKVKVIFNKWTDQDAVFEFLITKVEESHEQDNLMCTVSCEGLAFHELGKVGYKRALTAEGFYNAYNEWQEAEVGTDKTYADADAKAAAQPICNLQYWMEDYDNGARIKPVPKTNKIIDVSKLNPTEWYYDIRISHDSLFNTSDVVEVEDKIYVESYVDSWTDDCQPASYSQLQEMTRVVDLKESNLYNITQDLAEKFEVFCRYEYLYDRNYNIIGRIIVFYNNFLKERENVETLMYPNSASKITREMDSTDISTKMFVRSVDAPDLYTGTINIMDSEANKTKEDYVMNFDYLHDIGTISEEQYNEIPEYEKTMRELNSRLEPLQNAQKNLSDVLVEVKAKNKVLEESIKLDEERITENMAFITGLDSADGDSDGFITRDYRNPEVMALMKDSSNSKYDTYYVQFNQNEKCMGVQPETLKLYKEYHTTSSDTVQYGIRFGAIGESNYINNTNNSGPNDDDMETLFSDTKWVSILEYKGTIDKKTSLDNNVVVGEVYQLIKDNNNKDISTITLYIGIKNGNQYEWAEIKTDNKLSKGFYIIKKTTHQQRNGFTTIEYNAHKYGYRANTTTDYITNLRKLYYLTTANTPKDLTYNKVKNNETKIYTTDEINQWTTYFPYVDNMSDSYKYYTAWEISKYKSNTTYPSSNNITGKDKADIKDMAGNTINKIISDKGASFFNNSEITGGIFVYDEYGNLDKVKGLFKRNKTGSYYTYYTSDTPISAPTDTDKIETQISNFKKNAKSITYPSNIKNKYVITQEQKYCPQGQIIYHYYINYYNKNGVSSIKAPTGANGSLKELYYVYYKKDTQDPNVPTTVVNTDTQDQWTTVLPTGKKTDIYFKSACVVKWDKSRTYYTDRDGTTIISDDNLKPKRGSKASDSTEIPNCLYATFKYKPDWYYEKIKDSWIRKLDKDKADLDKYSNRQTKLETFLDNIKAKINELVKEKEAEIARFEHMMGAALRESYWQPENEYQESTKNYSETMILPLYKMCSASQATFFNNITDKYFANVGWDSITFENEDKLYYESGINQDRHYYPCIDLGYVKNDNGTFIEAYHKWVKTNNEEEPFVFAFNPSTSTIPSGENDKDLRYMQYYTIGSRAKIAFMRTGLRITPVLVLTDAYQLSDAELQNMYNTGRICQLKTVENDNNEIALKMSEETTYSIPNNRWVNVEQNGNQWVERNNLEKNELVYPRIMIPSLKLKTGDNISVQFNDQQLTEYEDYYVLTKSYYLSEKNGGKFTASDNNTYRRMGYGDVENEAFVEKSIRENIKLFTNVNAKGPIKDEDMMPGEGIDYDSTDTGTSTGSATLKSWTKEDVVDIVETQNIYNCYTVTLKPEVIFRGLKYSFKNKMSDFNQSEEKIKINYKISNTDVDIYLSAKKVLKENAYPKVSYSIEVSKWSPDLLTNLHTKLAQLVMINDFELKLKNTFGYISGITLDLDHEEQDTIEVKNYKTKFEDLFSKIVAETEEMHKNERNIGLASALAPGGTIDSTLSPEALRKTLSSGSQTRIVWEDFLKEYFDGYNVVQEQLQSLFTEAGEILASASNSLGSVMNVTTKNASILAGFRENMVNALTPKVYTGNTPPTNFKAGDVWKHDDGSVSVATGNPNGGAFISTYNGKVSAIEGPAFGLNAETGEIDIINTTNINLMSGKTIVIAANDNVEITGNKAVNIGGTTINIASVKTEASDQSGGINLVSTLLNSDETGESSYVNVHGDGIELASRNGITIKSGAGIDIKSSDEQNVSAVVIDKERGIYIGSNKKLTLFSGKTTDKPIIDSTTGQQAVDEYGNLLWQSYGANIELSPEQLLLGMSNFGNTGATAIAMTDTQIILAAGSAFTTTNFKDNNNKITFTGKITENTNLSGVQIKSDYIGMATVSENNRSIFALTPGRIKMGTMSQTGSDSTKPENFTGSFLWLDKEEIYIASGGHLTLNTNNIKLQSKNLNNKLGPTTNNNYNKNVSTFGFALGKNLQNTFSDSNTNNQNPDVGLAFWIDTNSNKHLVIDADELKANVSDSINVNGGSINVTSNGQISISSGAIDITSNGKLNINSGTIDIDSDNFTVHSKAINKDTIIFYAGDTAQNNYIKIYNKVGRQPTFELKVAEAANIKVGNGDISSALKMTDSDIWLGVKNATKNMGLKITDNKITISGTGELKIDTDGELYIDTTNVILNTSAGNGKIIFRLKDEDTNYFTISKTSAGNISAILSGWHLTKNKLYSGSGVNYVALDSGTTTTTDGTTTTEPYAIWCGATKSSSAKFRVKRSGDVYLNSLMVKDINGEIVPLTDTENRDGNYARIDFSGLNFKSAVSLSLNWSGTTLNARATFFGKEMQTISQAGTFQILSVNVSSAGNKGQDCSGTGKVVLSIGGSNIQAENISCTVQAQSVYTSGHSAGYADAANVCPSGASMNIQPGSSRTISLPSAGGGTRSYTITANSGSSGCFVKGSLVTLYDNSKIPIEDLAIGMKLLSYDEETQDFKETEVQGLQQFKHNHSIYDLYFSSGEKLTVTSNHPILTIDGWKALNITLAYIENPELEEIGVLSLHDKIMTSVGQIVELINIHYREDLQDETVYNCNVEPVDTYIVNNIIVHNADKEEE